MQERYVYPPGLQPPQSTSPPTSVGNPNSLVDQNSPQPGSQSRTSLQGSHHNFAELRSVASNSKMTGDSIKKGSVRQFSTCVGCGGQIHDQFILRVAPNLEWHAACLKCNECQMFLDENCTCFVRDGKTYCKKDYLRLFGTKCEKCHRSFGKTDFVMRAKNKIFHLDCFRCVACEKQLIPGDEFALRRDGLFCKEDHQVDIHPGGGNGPGSNTVSPIPPDASRQSALDMKMNANMTKDSLENNNNNTILGLQGAGAGGQQMQLMHNTSNSSEDNSEAPCDLSDDDMSIVDTTDGDSINSNTLMVKDKRSKTGYKKASDRKGARARTVLSEKQLNILKTCYSANPRPDALMKEQLVEMTTLSPRVIRVWFQNKRCKDKKIQQRMQEKQMQRECDGRKLGYGPMHGIPMVATSPVRHDSPVGPGMIGSTDIQSYEPPWKALSDFALHTDLDRLNPNTPHFQHLVNQMHGYPPDMGPDGMHGGPLGPPPPPPGEMPFHHGGPGGHMNLTPPPQSMSGHPNGPPGLQGPPDNNGGMYQPPDIPYMDGPGGCPPLGTDLSGEPRNSPIPGMLPTTEVV